MPPPAKRFLGDEVYVEFLEGSVVLTTEYLDRVQNKICLDEAVLAGLLAWVEELALSQKGGN